MLPGSQRPLTEWPAGASWRRLQELRRELGNVASRHQCLFFVCVVAGTCSHASFSICTQPLNYYCCPNANTAWTRNNPCCPTDAGRVLYPDPNNPSTTCYCCPSTTRGVAFDCRNVPGNCDCDNYNGGTPQNGLNGECCPDNWVVKISSSTYVGNLLLLTADLFTKHTHTTATAAASTRRTPPTRPTAMNNSSSRRTTRAVPPRRWPFLTAMVASFAVRPAKSQLPTVRTALLSAAQRPML